MHNIQHTTTTTTSRNKQRSSLKSHKPKTCRQYLWFFNQIKQMFQHKNTLTHTYTWMNKFNCAARETQKNDKIGNSAHYSLVKIINGFCVMEIPENYSK